MTNEIFLRSDVPVSHRKTVLRDIRNCSKYDPRKVPYCITRALIDAVNGDVENGLVFCDANVGRINEMTTVHELIQELAYGMGK